MHTHSQRKTHLLAAAVFSVLFLLLFSLIPGVKASAATKNYTSPCTGTKISYYNSNVTSFSTNSNVTITCSNKGSYTITVKPNTSTSSRTITLYAKKSANGATVDTLCINQSGVPTKSISAGCTGGNYAFTPSGASSYTYSNTAVCNSRSGSNFVVKPNTATSSRSCTVTVKNSAGNIIYYVYINQSGVPTSSFSVGCTGGNVAFSPAGASSYVYSNTAVCNSRSGNNFVVKPNSGTANRSCTVTVKNSAGNIFYYAYINQSGVPVKSVSVAGGSTNFSYGKSGAATINPQNKNMITNVTASNPGSFTIYVSANPSTTATRSSDIIVKNSAGAYLEIIRVTQAKYTAVTRNYNYNSDPRTVTFTSANTDPSKTTVSNTSMATCTSQGSGKYQVKLTQNTSTASRSCTITFKDQFGTPLEKYVVKQSGVPLNAVSVKGNNTSFSYGKSGATTINPQNKNMITNVTASNPGSFTIYVSANPSTTATRTSDIIVKNSSGVYLEIIRVTQNTFVPLTYNFSYNSDPHNINYYVDNVDVTKTVISNTSIGSVAATGTANKLNVKLTQNPSAASRSCTFTFKDKFGTVLEKLVLTQTGVPLKKQSISGGYTSFSYGNSSASTINPQNKNMIINVTASNPGSFTIYASANPSATETRTSDIIVKNSSGVYLEIIRVTQEKYTPPTISYSFSSKRSILTYSNSKASKFTYSNANMCNSVTSLGSGKYQFVINANNYNARSCTITVYDKFNTAIAKLSVKQSAVTKYEVGSGAGENITYYNKDAVKFNLPINIKSVRATNPGSFIFTQSVNRGTLKINRDIEVLDGNGNIIEYLNVISLPNIMNIKSSYNKEIPSAGKTFNVSFETSNPTTVTLTNAKFSDGTTTKSINKNEVRPNKCITTTYSIKVDKVTSTSDRTVTIKITNGLETSTLNLTQVGVGFKAARQNYPLGSFSVGEYYCAIASEAPSSWTYVTRIDKSDYDFDVFSALLFEMDECAGFLDFAVINGQRAIYNGADNYFVHAKIYKDSSNNYYAVITGNDSDAQRAYDNFPAAGIYNSGISFDKTVNGQRITGYIDEQHALDDNWVFWVGTDGKLRMNLRKLGKDSFKINGVEVIYNMGYSYTAPSTGTTISPYFPAASRTYVVPSKYQALLNKLYS